MDFFKIIILTLTSFTVLFILSKIMGYRVISELSFFDYVISITIGSISAEMSTNIDIEWYKGVTAMVLYALLDVLLAFISQRNKKFREFFNGVPIILIENGKINEKNLKKAKLGLDEVISSAREKGFFNISDVDCAVMENNGKISFSPKALKRPTNPKDFNFCPQNEGLVYNVIMDGVIMEENLLLSHITKNQLLKRINKENKNLNNILLATVDSNGVLTFFDK